MQPKVTHVTKIYFHLMWAKDSNVISSLQVKIIKEIINSKQKIALANTEIEKIKQETALAIAATE